jgi:hypothetical protein
MSTRLAVIEADLIAGYFVGGPEPVLSAITDFNRPTSTTWSRTSEIIQ